MNTLQYAMACVCTWLRVQLRRPLARRCRRAVAAGALRLGRVVLGRRVVEGALLERGGRHSAPPPPEAAQADADGEDDNDGRSDERADQDGRVDAEEQLVALRFFAPTCTGTSRGTPHVARGPRRWSSRNRRASHGTRRGRWRGTRSSLSTCRTRRPRTRSPHSSPRRGPPSVHAPAASMRRRRRRTRPTCASRAGAPRLMKTADGACKGVGWITFATQAAMEEAVSWNGCRMGGRSLQISAAKAAHTGFRPSYQARPASPSSRDDIIIIYSPRWPRTCSKAIRRAQHHLHHVMTRPPFHRVMGAQHHLHHVMARSPFHRVMGAT